MSTRSVQQVLPPPPPHMVGDGFRVHNFFPSGYDMDMARMSPFFLMDYGSKVEFPPSETPRGVGVHPHRGFETVTIAYHGSVAHHDSAGNSGVINAGDVQWMTAASGILHKEYHEKEYSKRGGMFQMVQLWVNLPAKFKMSPPKYQGIKQDQMGRFEIENDGGVVEVIAGEYKGVKGAASTFTSINVYNMRLKKGAKLDVTLPAGYNTGALVADGNILVNEADHAVENDFILFKNDGDTFTVQALEDSIVLVLNGEPIREPIVPYGPFLMNTKEEIMQAYRDVNSGAFGYLED